MKHFTILIWNLMKYVEKPDEKVNVFLTVQNAKHVVNTTCSKLNGDSASIIVHFIFLNCSLNPPFTPSWTPSSNCYPLICQAALCYPCWKDSAYNCNIFPHIILLKALQPLGYATAGFCKRVGKRWGAWKKNTSTNACWILICIALAILSLWE